MDFFYNLYMNVLQRQSFGWILSMEEQKSLLDLLKISSVVFLRWTTEYSFLGETIKCFRNMHKSAALFLPYHLTTSLFIASCLKRVCEWSIQTHLKQELMTFLFKDLWRNDCSAFTCRIAQVISCREYWICSLISMASGKSAIGSQNNFSDF